MDYRPYKRTNHALSYSMIASVVFARFGVSRVSGKCGTSYTPEGSVHLILGPEVTQCYNFIHIKSGSTPAPVLCVAKHWSADFKSVLTLDETNIQESNENELDH